MIPNRYSPRGGILQARLDNAPHSTVSAARSGGGIWGANRCDLLELTPLEEAISRAKVINAVNAVPKVFSSEPCPVSFILEKAGLDLPQRR